MKKVERSLYLSALLVQKQTKTKYLEVCPPNSLRKWKKRRGIDEDSLESKCNKRDVEELPRDTSNGTESFEDEIHFETSFHTEMKKIPEVAIKEKLEPGMAIRIPEPTPAQGRASFRSSQRQDQKYWNNLDKELKNDKLLSSFPRVLIYRC